MKTESFGLMVHNNNFGFKASQKVGVLMRSA